MKTRSLAAFIIGTFLLTSLPAWGSVTGINVIADKNEATLEDQIILSVTIEGDRGAFPQVPTIPHFKVVRQGGASTQVQFGSAGYRSSVEYTFILTPKKIGSFTIPSFTVKHEGKAFKSQPFQVKIIPAAAVPKGQRDLFITATVSKPSPVVQEQILYTWRFFKGSNTQIDGRSPRVEFPEFEGFLALQQETQREYTTVTNGKRFDVTEINFVLFPQEDGKLTIPGSSMTLDVIKASANQRRDIFGDLFQRGQRVSKRLMSESIEVDVRALPSPPPTFTGLVGQFEARSSLSHRSLATGESTTLTLRISGSGNLNAIKPPFPQNLKGFKIYHDKATSQEVNQSDGITGYKEFRAALVPLSPGAYTIPAIEVVYFDPKLQTYQKATSPEYQLTVTPGTNAEKLNLTGSSTTTNHKQAVETLGDDILPLHEDLGAIDSSLAFLRMMWGQLIALLLPPLVFTLLFLQRRRTTLEQSDTSLRRKRLALHHALKNLKKLQGSDSEQITAKSTILRQFIGDKLNLEGKALTPAEAAEQLRRASVQDSMIDQVSEFLKLSEATQYGSPSLLPNGEAPIQIQKLLSRLDKELPS